MCTDHHREATWKIIGEVLISAKDLSFIGHVLQETATHLCSPLIDRPVRKRVRLMFRDICELL